MGKIKDYFKDLKKDIIIELEEQKKEEKSLEEIKNKAADEIEEQILEEKQDMKILGTIVVFVLFLFLVIVGVLYLALHKHLDKLISKIIDTIPVTEIEKTQTEEQDPNIDTPKEQQTEKPKSTKLNCTKPFDGTYKNKNEEIVLMFDGSYDKSKNDNYIASGTYTIKNGTITVVANPESDITKEITIVYSISRDCKTLTDKSSNKKYTKQ